MKEFLFLTFLFACRLNYVSFSVCFCFYSLVGKIISLDLFDQLLDLKLCRISSQIYCNTRFEQ